MKRVFLYLLFFIIVAILSIVIDYSFNRLENYKIDKDQFEATLHEKQAKVEKAFQRFEKNLKKDSTGTSLFNDFTLIDQSALAFVVSKDGRFIFWSDNTIPYNEVDTTQNTGLVDLGNGWYWIENKKIGAYKVYGFILIKKKYTFENQYIKDCFQEDFNIPGHIEIYLSPENGVQIQDSNNIFLFSLVPPEYKKQNKAVNLASGLGYLITLIFLFLFSYEFLRIRSGSKKIWAWWLGTTLILILVRYGMVAFEFPKGLYDLKLFDPGIYASSKLIPSLGDLILLLITIWFLVFTLTLFAKDRLSSKVLKGFSKYFIFLIVTLFNVGWFVFTINIIDSIVYNSSISLSLYNFFNLSVYSFFALFCILLAIANYFLVIHLLLVWLKSNFRWKNYLIFFHLFALLAIIILIPSKIDIQFIPVLFYFTVNFIFALFLYRYAVLHYTRNIVLLFISVLFLTYFTEYHSDKKERQKRRILVTNLENERDRIGEYLLEGIEEELSNDQVLKKYMKHHLDNEPKIYDYLQNEYFNSYFRKYDLQISVCDPKDDLEVVLDNNAEIYHCYSFFRQMINEEGIPLSGSNFYFLDNLNGRISYIGLIKYYAEKPSIEKTLYISLDSKLTNTHLGYPELLLDRELTQPGPLNEYSYAKYKSGQLIRRSGGYNYPMELINAFRTEDEFQFKNFQEYNHLIYDTGDGTTILISKPKRDFLDLLAQFAYLFAFFYILFILFIFFLYFPENITRFNYNFKNKIKLSMILILFLSLIAVGTGTVYYTTQQFQKKQKETISEKLQSILVELDNKLGMESYLYEDYQPYINDLLEKFSNVFYVDMNLYDLEGHLLASSRPQIFEKGLLGEKMNAEAFKQLSVKNQPKFIHTESIGEMKYHSAYVPFYNFRGERLAYLNLPYFTRQKTLQKEVYTIITVMVNIYVFLIILGTIIAVFVSNNITKPLRLIQLNLRNIGLNQRNEKINYQSHDEIGELIREYNRMVDELEENARKLAQTERESAWREMAKQIAHEIKNPLTPMKLKVQYLKRAWDDKVSDFDERMKQFTESMISQINTLSGIATEFSNFAKMPRAKNEKISIHEQAENIVSLFENTENIEVKLEDKTHKTYYVYADQDQISRVLNNLVKNGIQSIPKEQKGEVVIGLKSADHKVLISVMDNGKGIPEDIQDKLFAPNFTTKSSGMGMGLAITKKIIEDTGGKIWYETEVGKGTTFYVELPIYEG